MRANSHWTHCERDALPTELYPRIIRFEELCGDSQLMQNTKIRGQSNFGNRSIGIGLPNNAATADKVGDVVVNRALLWRWRNRRLSLGFEGVVQRGQIFCH